MDTEENVTIDAKTLHDLSVALNVAHLKGEVVEFMFRHQDYAEVRDFVGSKVCGITGAQHLMLTSEDGSRSDWFGEDAPQCCRNCAKASADFEKSLPPDFFAEGEAVVVMDGDPLPDMNLPRYCPMRSAKNDDANKTFQHDVDCFLFCLLVAMDKMTYHAMMAAKPLTPNRSSRGIHERIKMYLISLPFQPQVLNFRANMGISATSR